jgi:flagellar protein FlgJ
MSATGIGFATSPDLAFQTNINANLPVAETVQQAAQSFEALYVQMLLKTMRSVNQTLKSEFSASQENDTYQDLLDQQLSIALSASKSLGIANLIAKQLGG